MLLISDNNFEIPKQIATGNICPCNSKSKGDYYISQKRIFETAIFKYRPKVHRSRCKNYKE